MKPALAQSGALFFKHHVVQLLLLVLPVNLKTVEPSSPAQKMTLTSTTASNMITTDSSTELRAVKTWE